MIFDKLFELRAHLENPSTSLSDPANWLFNSMGAVPTSANIVVNERNANQITAFWAAVNIISDTVAELPIRLIKSNPNGTTKVIRNHPSLNAIRMEPNPWMNSVTLKSTMQQGSLVWGNGYGWIKRNGFGEVAEIWPLLPHNTKPIVSQELNTLVFQTQVNGKVRDLQPEEVIHIPALSRNGIVGMSVIAEARESIGGALAAQKFGSKFFANGAHPGGMISFPGKVQDPNKIRDQIEKQTGGENSSKMLIVDGDGKFQPFAVPPEDAQFLETRKFDVEEVGRMFRLPGHFLNQMGQATFNNLEAMGTHFVTYTMMPWIVRWEQELTRKLLSESERRRGFNFKFNVSALIRGDVKTRSEVYAKAIVNGWMTRNEVRELEDLNPLEGLDDPLIPLNLGVVGEEPDDDPAPAPIPGEPAPASDPDPDDPDERTYLMAKAAAERVANREAVALRKILAHDWPATELAEQVGVFYTRHQQIVEQTLVMDETEAAEHCRRHAEQIIDATSDGNFEDIFLVWQTEESAVIAAQIVR